LRVTGAMMRESIIRALSIRWGNHMPIMDTQLNFAWLESLARSNDIDAAEAGRIKRLLQRHPDLIDKAIIVAKQAKARGAARIRTDWILAELSMFHGLEVGNENREALARLVLDHHPDLKDFIHLRTSKRADFLKRKESRA
jgi:hypothetical protein